MDGQAGAGGGGCDGGREQRVLDLFHLEVPGGKWHAVISRPVCRASAASVSFQARVRLLFEPPESAVTRSRRASGQAVRPASFHQRRIDSAANPAVSWSVPTDRNFYNWQHWCTAAALLWRVKSDLTLPPLVFYPDGSYRSVLVNPKVRDKARAALLEAARAGGNLDPQNARYVRAIGYEVPDREGDGKHEVIALIATVLDFPDAPAAVLAAAHHERWKHDRERPAQDLPPRPGKDPALRIAGHGEAGDLGYLLIHTRSVP